MDLRAEPGSWSLSWGPTVEKTTPFRCILGLLPGYQGCVRVDGCDVSSLAPRALAKKIAYIPQTSHYHSFPTRRWSWCSWAPTTGWAFSPRRAAGSGPSPWRPWRSWGSRTTPTGASRSCPVESSSLYWRPGLAQQARLLLMDEPTSALDFGNQVRVLERVSALTLRGTPSCSPVTTHRRPMLYAQRVAALHDGLVAADGPPDQALDEALMRKLYGVPARFVRTGDGAHRPGAQVHCPVDPRHGALHGRRHPGQRELCGHGRSPVSGAPPGGAGVRRGVRARRVESGAGPLLPRGGRGSLVRRGHPPSGGTAPASQRGAPAVRCAGRHTGRALRRYGVLLLRPHG